jgi:hypothetical protein
MRVTIGKETREVTAYGFADQALKKSMKASINSSIDP